MKKTYSSPATTLFSVGTTATILAGSPIGNKVFDENASNEQPVLSREQPRNYSVWDDEEEEEQ